MRLLNVLGNLMAMAGILLSIGATNCSRAQESPTNTGTAVTVAADGSGDFKTVQEAINAAPKAETRRFTIRIKPGTYKEKLTVPKDKGPITFLGEDAATTILTFSDHAKTLAPDGTELGTSKSTSILIQAPDFHAENITFENSAGPVGQAVAVNVWSDRGVFRKCRFLGWQDTLLTNRNRQYFEDCYIEGSTDYIFGASTAWFERCHLHCKTSSYITAASTPQEKSHGYVFSNCTITAEPGVKMYLGRPWRPYASVTFLNTRVQPDVIRPEGWENWRNPENEKTARYAEYNSKTLDDKPVDVSQRVPWSKQLTAEEAAQYTTRNVLAGTDNWNPTRITVISATSAEPVAGLSVAAVAGTQSSTSRLPTLWIIGDSTVRSGDGTGSDGHWGWGDPIAAYFDWTKIKIVNRARGGRSSRTFITEGLWDAVLKELQPGDFVLMQFGHNDSVAVEDIERPRGSIRSTGEETREITNPKTGQKEIVRTYGSYMRQMLKDARTRGATPIVLSPVPRKRWTAEGKIVRNLDNYTTLSREVAQAQGVTFFDLNAIIADQYDKLGKVKVDELFPKDGTHHNLSGADLNADSVIAGLKSLRNQQLNRFLSPKGQAVAAYMAINPAQ